jgi:hypothetical protein
LFRMSRDFDFRSRQRLGLWAGRWVWGWIIGRGWFWPLTFDALTWATLAAERWPFRALPHLPTAPL